MVALTHPSTHHLLLLLLLLSPYLSSARYYYASRRFFRRRQQTPRPRRVFRSWKSSGLFVSEDQVHSLQANRTLRDVFLLESTQVAFPLEGGCGGMLNDFWEAGGQEQEGGGEMFPKCEEGPTVLAAAQSPSTILGCCRTVMQVEFPVTVTSVVTSQRHQVLQFAASSQLVHTGRCESEGATCTLGGRCTTFFRLQWLLVRGAPLTTTQATDGDGASEDGSSDDDEGGTTTTTTTTTTSVVDPFVDLFVPAMVPNHCQCVFS